MKFVDKFSVLIIHRKSIERFGGIHGLRDAGALESAVNAAETRFHYETEDAAKLAATYAYHLSQAHAFLDGNKRIAAAVTGVFLEINGFLIEMTEDEVIELFLAIAAGEMSREAVEEKFSERLIEAEN